MKLPKWKGRRRTLFRELLKQPLTDLYHWLLVISWSQFLILISLVYVAINILFALAYLSTGNGIAKAEPGSFSDAFFFSVQTMSTIGYGAMYPQNLAANILMTIEVLVGLLLVAMTTGLMFARFSRPTARVIFSRVAVVCPYDGIPTLMFRVANQRENRIIEAQIRVSFLRNQVSSEGHQLRRFYDLQLLRSQTPVFGLSWLVMHPINEQSPLYKMTVDSLITEDGQIWIALTGLDETLSQTIHARYIYGVREILWSMRFIDIFSRSSDGSYAIDYRHFHDVIPVNSPSVGS